MKYTIAIQPDDYTYDAKSKDRDAFSPEWANLLKKEGHEVKWVNAYSPDILEQLKECHGFMWRWAHFGGMGRIARRLLPVIENTLGLVVYPDQKACWHYNDKIAQYYLFKALNIPTPKTWVFFNREEAEEWASKADYPIVLKLATGAGSSNVKLIHNSKEASTWIGKLFNWSFTNLSDAEKIPLNFYSRIKKATKIFLTGKPPYIYDNGYDLQSGYILFQEFLPNNNFTTRVIIIGNKAFTRLRFNRKNDFRVSDDGIFDTDPKKISLESIKLGFDTASLLTTQCIALDILNNKDNEPVITEMSYTFPGDKAWKEYPGYWNNEIKWVPGKFNVTKAQIDGFLKKLDEHYMEHNNNRSKFNT